MEPSITFGSIPNMELSFRMEDVRMEDIPESPVQRVVTQQVVPHQVTPRQVTPQQVTPQQVTPQQVTPQQVAPRRIVQQQQQFVAQQVHMQRGQAHIVETRIPSQEMPQPMTKSFSFKAPHIFRLYGGSVVQWLDGVPVPEEDEESGPSTAAAAQQPHGEKHGLDHEMSDRAPEEGCHRKRPRLSVSPSTRPGFAKRRGKIAQKGQGFVRRVSDVYQRVVSTSSASQRSASWSTGPYTVSTTPTTPATPTTPTTLPYRPKISFVVVGDSACGKSSLLFRYCHNTFYEEYTPTQYDMYNKTAVTNKCEVDVEMWDTSGSIKLHQLQRLSYMRWSAVLLCFNLTDQESFDHAQGKWAKEIGIHCRGAPIILIGLNKDGRSISPGLLDPFQIRGTRISAGEGSMAARGMGAAKYMECSSKTGEGVKRVFDESIRIALDDSNEEEAAHMAKGKSQARRLGEALCFA